MNVWMCALVIWSLMITNPQVGLQVKVAKATTH